MRRAGAGLYNFLPATGLQIGPTFTPGKLDFAPRSGLAWWAPFRSGNWVVRGGFGVFYDVPSVSEFTVSASTSNRGASGLAYNPAGPNADLHALGQECVSCSGCADFRFGCGYAAVRRLLRQPELLTMPHVRNYNLNVQRKLSNTTLVQAGFVGSEGCTLATVLDINQVVNGVRPYAEQYPTLAGINQLNSFADSAFTSLQVSLHQPLWKG